MHVFVFAEDSFKGCSDCANSDDRRTTDQRGREGEQSREAAGQGMQLGEGESETDSDVEIDRVAGYPATSAASIFQLLPDMPGLAAGGTRGARAKRQCQNGAE